MEDPENSEHIHKEKAAVEEELKKLEARLQECRISVSSYSY